MQILMGKIRIEVMRVDHVKVAERQWVKKRDRLQGEDQDNYGYIEDPVVKEIKTTILVQEVDEMDLGAVIKAINKL